MVMRSREARGGRNMSVQFGRWNVDGRPVDREYLKKVKAVIAPYGPDDNGAFTDTGISIVYQAFHTTEESRRETQPHVTASGAVITWDGRLDNRAELIRHMREVLTTSSTDVSIVAAAYEEWGTECFARLIGDWALSIWDAHSRSLTLAKDLVGTRHLYYSIEKGQVTWSTILDPLVLFAGKPFDLCEEYIAGWFSSFSAAHLTPYIGISSVPPCSSVRIQQGNRTIRNYWDFDPGKIIRYRTDAEYEEHFRAVFCEAVRRRLRSDRPILAELSGGMDSSSIVCMADTIIACGSAETPRLDTVSYYNDSEPNWDERPYFTTIERKRGRVGCHIDTSGKAEGDHEFNRERPAVTPGSAGLLDERLVACLASQANRVVLSGTGGDEVTGGVPTPIPELEDLFSRGEFRALAHHLKVWALNKRKPWFHLFFETTRGFLPPQVARVPMHKRPPAWLDSQFVKRNRVALYGYENRIKLFGPLPSFQENLSTLDVLRRQLASEFPSSLPCLEKRYPYLDRNLLEFLYAIPREQFVRPGERRSLMRRALANIVPGEILNRKRKAFVVRAPRVAISNNWARIVETSRHCQTVAPRIVNLQSLLEALQNARRGEAVPLVRLLRTLAVIRWLWNLEQWNVVRRPGDETGSLVVKKQSHFVRTE
jgi:asparagine synthase (glutamine-hydrolysing)